eukprot:CAMPEP_0203677226 /NCGR_PEP_ID=MMETSP0090-20130426/27495_1 /ASSEMBLY_ACC=CAM_ASM_001088 /TAXON_ID=426623 /ORGANISM="Chaetoceros affinis, Strain CCMP159" /LENGTH=455 /DNA_ID=CAMNT_0050544057 /DNA_START=96 /DNA_END=1460 /DNA_ORIENTATION=+
MRATPRKVWSACMNTSQAWQTSAVVQRHCYPKGAKRDLTTSSPSSHLRTSCQTLTTKTNTCNSQSHTTTTAKTKKLPSSPNPSETTVDDVSSTKQKSSAHFKLDPRAIFPWRHSPQPLLRLNPTNDEFDLQGGYVGPHLPPLNVAIRTVLWVNSTGFLGAKLLSYWAWKEELECGFQVAFATAVQCLMLDVYRINQSSSTSNENNENNESDESGDDITTEKDADNGVNGDDNNDGTDSADMPSIQFNHNIDPLPTDELPSDLNHDKTIQSNTRNMLENSLICLYKSAHEHMKHRIKINLQSTPKSATIMSLITVPFLTREEVREKPALKHSFRNIWKGLRQGEVEKGSKLSYIEIMNHIAHELDQLANKQMRRQGEAKMQVTIIAQVAIQCDEIFQVVDVETGDTVQGDSDGRVQEVTHLVRFEMVVNLDGKTGEIEIGTWQIVDWDDLLDGNIW